MDRPRHYYIKWSKSDRKRPLYDIAYLLNLGKKKGGYKRTYLQNRNRPTDIENKLVVTKRDSRRETRERNWETGIKATIYKIDKQGPTT